MAGSAVIGALRVMLSIDTAEFRSGLEGMRSGLMNAGRSMQDVGKQLSLKLTAPIAAFGGIAIKTAGDFEAAMNRMQAASGASAEEIAALQAMAMKLGADTPKSASEAADAMEMLAKNGLSAQEILDGAAQASIRLSVATGGDLADSADVATNVMAQFGAKAQDLGKIVDHITGVTLQSQFGFEDYSLAIGQAGGVAGALGVSLDDFNATIAATSSVFASGSDAGTSFKSFLTSLVPKSKGAAEVMKELNISFFNADGSMKSMAGVAQELRDKMAGLSQLDLNEKMNTLFGVDGMRTAIALMQQGGDGITQMNAKIQAASADEQAAARMKGFNGEMEKLGGALENLQLAIANSGLLAFVTEIVQGISGFVDTLSQTNPEILKWGTVVAGLALIIGPVVTAVGLLAAGIAAIGIPIAAVVAGITALTVAIVAFWPQIQTAAQAVSEFVSGAWAQFVAAWDGIVAKVSEVTAAVTKFATDLIAIFQALPGQMLEIGGQIIDGLWQGIQNRWNSVKDSVTGIASGIKDSFTGFFDIHSPSKVMEEIGRNIMQGLGNGITGLKGTVVGAANGVATDVKGSFSSMKDAGSSMGSAFSGVFDGLIDGSKSFKESIHDLLGDLASMWKDKALQALFGGGGASGVAGNTGGLFGGLLGGIGSLFGFANGGSFQVGGAGGIDSQLVAFRASPNEKVSVTKPGQTADRGTHITFGVAADNNGNLLPFVRSVTQSGIRQAAPQILGQAKAQVMPTVGAYQRDRAGGDYRNGI
ncbi:phage tail tape measure protein [Rhizobium ruizarguesonis]